MNKQGNDKIQWAEWTWNPASGCLNTCEYCYARKIAMRFRGHFFPEFWPGRLKQVYELKKPSRIFVGSASDTWGPWVPEEWINKVMKVVTDNPRHTFMFLTKYPAGYGRIDEFPDNAWIGVTPTEKQTLNDVSVFNTTKSKVKFLSIEPLMTNKRTMFDQLINPPDWVIVGGLTPSPPVHEERWVTDIVERYHKDNIPVFLKKNLKYPHVIQEMPKGYKKGV